MSLFLIHVDNKGTDQLEHQHSLISAFVITSWKYNIKISCTQQFSILARLGSIADGIESNFFWRQGHLVHCI